MSPGSVSSDYASLWDPNTVATILLATYLEENCFSQGWQLNGEPVLYTDLQAATQNASLTEDQVALLGSPTSYQSIGIIKPDGATWSEAIQLRTFSYPSSADGESVLATLLQSSLPEGATDLSDELAATLGGRMSTQTVDFEGFPIVQTIMLFASRHWIFEFRHLDTDRASFRNEARLGQIQELAAGLSELTGQFATADRIVRRLVPGYADPELVQVAASFRSLRFAGMAGVRQHFYKLRGTHIGFFGEPAEQMAARQARSQHHECHSATRGTLPDGAVFYEHHARIFATADLATAFFSSEDPVAQEQIDPQVDLELQPDEDQRSETMTGHFARRTDDNGSAPGYLAWLLTGPVLNSFAFYDLAQAGAPDGIDPSSPAYQRMKAGALAVVQQFQRGLAELSPWPELSIPEEWQPSSTPNFGL